MATITTTATIEATTSWNQTDTEGNRTVRDIGSNTVSFELNTGSGQKQADAVWNDERTIGSGSIDNFDLQALNRDLLGSSFTMNFHRIRALTINNKATTPGASLRIAATGVNGWTEPFGGTSGSIHLPPSGMIQLMNIIDGYDVDANNKDFQIIDYGGSGVTYGISIIGVTGV